MFCAGYGLHRAHCCTTVSMYVCLHERVCAMRILESCAHQSLHTRMPIMKKPRATTHSTFSSHQVIRVRWDGSQVTRSEVHDFLPTLLQSTAVKPCLVVLDDAWNIEQVRLDLGPLSFSHLTQTHSVCFVITRLLYTTGRPVSTLPYHSYPVHSSLRVVFKFVPTLTSFLQIQSTVQIARKVAQKVRVLITTRNEHILQRLDVSIQV